MKKNFIYALLSATALLGAATFTSCKSDPEVVDNPNYDPETKMVNAQFVLNVAAYPTDNNTRQNISTVQQDQKFRGMQDAWLIALKTGETVANFGAPYNSSVNIASGGLEAYNMGTLYTESYFGEAGATVNNEQKSHRILRMKLPEGSDAMLVYARAIPKGTDAENGKVTYNINTTTPTSTSFSLVPRIGNNGTKYNNTCSMIAAIMNYIKESSVDAQPGGGSQGTYSTTEDLSALSWKNITGTSQLETILKNAFEKLSGISNDEFRDGSTSGILYQIYNLAVTLENVRTATATSPEELNAQRLEVVIRTRLHKFFSSTGSLETTTFKNMSDIADQYAILNEASKTSFQEKYTITDTELASFPSSLGLPHGVALLYYTSDGGFTYNNPTLSLVGSTSDRAPENFMYPAELLYFDNSTLRVNSKEVADDQYPDGYSNWNTGFTSADWSVGTITSSTRSIAVTNNINYGVAMLKTVVAKSGSTFEDNRANLTAETTNQTVDVETFKLNGVLIGGQNNVGWNYLSTASSAGSQIIYDNAIANQTIPTPGSGENYTLVFDNYISSDTQAGTVYVALEFQNGNKPFYGEKGLVQANGYFYLLGKLELTSGTGSVTWDSSYPVPPYNTTGTNKGKSTETPRIFIQDHVTEATFTIGQYSLQHAYLTVPDMREVQTSLGLSVDLQWLSGLTFTSLLGGGKITGN